MKQQEIMKRIQKDFDGELAVEKLIVKKKIDLLFEARKKLNDYLVTSTFSFFDAEILRLEKENSSELEKSFSFQLQMPVHSEYVELFQLANISDMVYEEETIFSFLKNPEIRSYQNPITGEKYYFHLLILQKILEDYKFVLERKNMEKPIPKKVPEIVVHVPILTSVQETESQKRMEKAKNTP